jgi:hemerythrin-like metal-binding protein
MSDVYKLFLRAVAPGWLNPEPASAASLVCDGILGGSALIAAVSLAIIAFRRRDRPDRWRAALGAIAFALYALMHGLEPLAPLLFLRLAAALAGLAGAVIFAGMVPRLVAVSIHPAQALKEEGQPPPYRQPDGAAGGRLSGGLAHDLNNLLGAMGGNVELAKLATNRESPVLPYLQTLEGLIRRSSILVQEVLGRPRPAAAEEAEARDFEEAMETYHGSGTVLVVEDEDPLRAAAVEALGRIGYDPLEASDGLEALQVFEANRDRIRIILMDLTMPGMDGEEAYRQLRAHGMLVPVLLTSGYSETEVLNHFRSRGIAGFLQKPYRLQTLARMVSKAMERTQPVPATRHLELRRPLPEALGPDSGLPLIDQQHQMLAKAFEQLVASLDLNMPWAEQVQALANLKEVALTHFGVEETLMDRLGYPRTREHQQSHARLIQQINDLASRIQHRTLHLSPALLDFLESWLVHHMQDEDRLLAQFAKGQGH